MNSHKTGLKQDGPARPPIDSGNKERFLDVLRFLLFVVLMAAILVGLNLLMAKTPWVGSLLRSAQAGVLDPRLLWIVDSTGFFVTLLVCVAAARLERRDVRAYGLWFGGDWWKLLVQGMLLGLTIAFADIGLTCLLGGYSFGSLALSPPDVLRYGFVWGGGFVLAGLFEEYLYRGYALLTLSRAAGFWPAAFLLAGIFAALHLLNHGETLYGAIDVAIYSLFASLTLRRKGSLWFAVGIHAAWDFSLTFLYAVPGSGMNAQHVLLHSLLHGKTWLTGNPAGPEGSAIGMGVLLAAFTACAKWMPRAPQDQDF